MRFRNQKIILLVGIGCLLVGSSVLAKNFTIYNATNVNLPYFSVNGTTGNVGIGLTSPTTPLQLLNNSWISAQNSLGTGTINMFKVNVNNQIEVGAPLNIGSFEFSPDSGLVTFVDMPVTSASLIGTSQSYVLKLDGDNIMTIYSESNGTGGIQNKGVGIGTMTPKGMLDVLGGLSIGAYAGVSVPPVNGMIISGNIGIGTTAPNDKLSIGSSGVAAPLGSADTGHNYTSTYLTADDYALTNYGLVKTLIGSATSSMTTLWGGTTGGNVWNLNSGNVGIGTTEPTSKLYIQANTLYSQYEAAAHGITIGTGVATDDHYLYMGADKTNDLSYIQSIGNQTFKPLVLQGRGGNVGIGTTNPGAKLEIAGMIKINSGSATDTIFASNTTGIILESQGNQYGTVRLNLQNIGGSNGALFQNLGVDLVDFGFRGSSNVQQNIRFEHRVGALKGTGNTYGEFQIGPADSPSIVIGTGSTILSRGNFGIGATAPNDKLSIGSGGLAAPAGSADTGHNYTSSYLSTDDYALTNYGLVKTLIGSATSSMTTFWGGTIGGDVWNLNTSNIGIGTTTPLFKFDINGTFRASSANISGLGSGVVMSDASGNLYATSTLPSGYATGVGIFVGASATSTTGTNNGNPGYDVAYSYCETDYVGSHVCTPDEMLNSIRHGALYPTVNVWIFSGPPGYTASANDCNGRRGAATTDLGAYWEGLTANFPKGRGLLMACNQSLKIACCK